MTLGMTTADIRADIDVIDNHIIDLIKTRRIIARQLMDARLAGGQPERDLLREADIIRHYNQALGFSGAMIAERLLILNTVRDGAFVEGDSNDQTDARDPV